MKQIAIYGKGGIGKSTITANLSAALAERGLRVLQIGCDPKHDSTKLLLHGTTQTTVIELLKAHSPATLKRENLVLRGYQGIDCIEAGGPEPGVGCAGRGILSMTTTLDAIGLDRSAYDVVVYDVLGDVVCGGFAVPMREGYADAVYIVSSGEIMALYAANNIARGLLRFSGKLGGMIGNARNVPHEEKLLTRFAQDIGSEMIAFFPRDDRFREAELKRCTVLEHAPDSDLADRFRVLAERIASGGKPIKATPLTEEAFEQLIFEVAGGEEPNERPRGERTAQTKTDSLSIEGFEGYLSEKLTARWAQSLSEHQGSKKGDHLGQDLNATSASPVDPYQSKALRERAPLHSCALAGAFSITNHVLDAVTMMHSPAGCAHTSLAGTYIAGEGASLRGLQPTPSHAIPRLLCTNLKETDSVLGGEDKLEAEVRAAVARHSPAGVFLITSCPSAIVGDDAFKVARRLADLPVPVIATDTDGIMKGDYAQGMINAYRNLTEAFILQGPPPEPDPSLVNLVGEEPIGNSADEDLARLMPLLEAVGLTVNTRFVRRTTVASLLAFRRAPFSVRMSNGEPARMAQRMLEEKAGARFLDAPAPIGFGATARFVNALAAAVGRPMPQELISRAEVQRAAAVARLRPVFAGKRVLLGVYTQNVSWVAELAEAVGFDLVGLAVLESCMNTDLAIVDVPNFEVKDAHELIKIVHELRPDLFLANYLPRGLPEGLRADTVPLCPPLGFVGTIRLAEAWARTLRRGPEGWRLDQRFAELRS